ncbi:MAG: hypothetical protein QM266_03045 [Bacillota bacterium]|nr:hypothetical protein [Bacillota bacterium]
MQGFFRKKRGAFTIGVISGIITTVVFVIAINILIPARTFNVATAEDTLGETNLEQIVLHDSNNIKITSSSFYMDEIMGNYMFEIEIENKTDNPLYVYSDKAALNHYIVDPRILDNNEIKANSIKSLNIEFSKNNISDYNIREVGLIEFDLSVEKSERFFGSKPDILEYLYQLSIETDKYGSISETYVYEGGLTVLDQDGILVQLSNPDTVFKEDEIVEIYLENNTNNPHFYYFTYFRNLDADTYIDGALTISMYPNSKRLMSLGNFLPDGILDYSIPIVSSLGIYDDSTIYDSKPIMYDSYDVIYWSEVK